MDHIHYTCRNNFFPRSYTVRPLHNIYFKWNTHNYHKILANLVYASKSTFLPLISSLVFRSNQLKVYKEVEEVEQLLRFHHPNDFVYFILIRRYLRHWPTPLISKMSLTVKSKELKNLVQTDRLGAQLSNFPTLHHRLFCP